jgi:hypothetical protein
MRGITEVPIKLNVNDSQLRRLLVDLREQVVELRKAQAPLAQPTNLKGTALAFAALIEWTRVTNADYYEVLWNSSGTLKTAVVQAVGDSQRWIDNVGQTAIKRYYWVRARRYNGASSLPAGAVIVTTLAAAAGVAPTAPPPAGHIQITNQATGHIVYLPVAGSSGRLNSL